MSDARPTLADVATAAGVSRALVSIVIRGAPGASAQTRTRVLAVAAALGYRPDQRARALREREPRLLGVMFGLQHAFHSDLVSAIYPAAESIGYDVVLSGVTAGRSEQRAVETLLDERCAALILLGPVASPAWLAGVARRTPVVTIARRLRADGVDTVRTDDARGIALAVQHLADLGHQRILHIDGGRAPGAADRRRGYSTAMKRLGLGRRAAIVAGGGHEDDGARAAATLLGRARPTAVVAFNDACAVGVMDTFLRAGICVPDDVSVIGFDDSRLARLTHIKLTTVAQPIDELAHSAVRRVLERLDASTSPEPDRALEPHLIVRSTTAAAPRRGSPATSTRS